MPPYDQQPLGKIDTKSDKYSKMGMGLSPNEKSIIDFGETLWNLIGQPSLTSQAERGQGLFGQWQRPDWTPDQSQQDLKFTLSKYF